MDNEELFNTTYVSSPRKHPAHEDSDFGFTESEFSMKNLDNFGKNITRASDENTNSSEPGNEEAHASSNEVSDIIEDIDDFEPDNEEISEDDSHVTGEVEGHGIYYKTKDVAKELGISVQDVRNYDKMFEEFLNVERTPSGHRLFTREYIDKMASILELKRINGYTFEQTKEALSTDEGQVLSERNEMERLHKLLELMTSRIELTGKEIKNAVRSEVEQVLNDTTQKLLTDSSEHNNETLEELRKQNAELKQAVIANQASSSQSIIELKEQLNISRAQNAEMMEMLKSVLADQHNKDKKISELAEQNEKVLAEVSKKRKGWLFFNK